MKFTPAEIRKIDSSWKPPGFDDDADRIWKLYQKQGREIVLEYLRTMKMGNYKEATDPVMLGLIPQLVQKLAVLYSQPATRILKRGTETLEPDSREATALSELADRMSLDAVWSQIDEARACLRQCVVVFASSPAHGSLVARVFGPQVTFRVPSPGAADVLEQDEAFCLMLRDADEEDARIYQLWERTAEGWCAWVVTGRGQLVGEQPFGESGVVPYRELSPTGEQRPCLPVVLIVDQLLGGHAYLPVSQPRLNTSLATDAIANDLMRLVQLEAHTQKAIMTDDKNSVPDKVGPDQLWVLGRDDKAQMLAHSPHIADAGTVMDRLLAALAVAEGLPPTAFKWDRKVETGAALRVEERDLDHKRRKLATLTANQEAISYRKMAAILARDAGALGLQALDPRCRLLTTYTQSWASVSLKEQQEISFAEVSAGTKSLVEHNAEMRSISPEQSRAMWASIQADRVKYPAPNGQNPGALVKSGAAPALGEGSATKAPGAFNADRSSSVEGASLVEAAKANATPAV